MSAPDDGGPAFSNEHRSRGMSLRDWFAGQALLGLNPWIEAKQVAEEAYQIADAMLKARQKETT